MPKLTKRTVDGLRPDPHRELFASDNELHGFGGRLRSNGAGSYIVQYRNAERRCRRPTLGSLHVPPPEQARDIARENLAAVCNGEDPAEERKALSRAPTVAQVCDWYLEQPEAVAFWNANASQLQVPPSPSTGAASKHMSSHPSGGALSTD